MKSSTAISPKVSPEKEEREKSSQGHRESIETLVIALFLSILFKFFVAEAYVIPTGSMAPTLMGRHKDILCPECGFNYQVNASEEMDNDQNISSGKMVIAGTCPQCGYTYLFDPKKDPSYKGDRVIVNKCISDMRDTHRWDVSVFRCPADPKNNYIKRIVGLPDEDIRIQYGDLFARKVLPDGSRGEFEILRKPLEYLLPMLQTVDDDRFRAKRLLDKGWPRSWQDALSQEGDRVGWIETEEGFYTSGSPVQKSGNIALFCPMEGDLFLQEAKQLHPKDDSDLLWLRYCHIVPSSDDWIALDHSLPHSWIESKKIQNNPQLVTDLTAYNTGIASLGNSSAYPESPVQRKNPYGIGFNWTGDLALSCDMEFGSFSENEEVIFELIKGGVAFRARIVPARGEATLEIPTVPAYTPETAPIALEPGKKNHITFMNIDEQMRLVINGVEVSFQGEGRYDHLCQPRSDGMPGVLPRNRDPNALDLTPAAIGVKSGNVEVSRLKIQRDIYYIAMGNKHIEPIETLKTRGAAGERLTTSSIPTCDKFFTAPLPTNDEKGYAQFYSHPQRWEGYGNTRSACFEQGNNAFLALGDNSSKSLDGRLWGDYQDQIPHYVQRDLLLGKAVCVFWPHSTKIPGTNISVVPNYSKMRGIK